MTAQPDRAHLQAVEGNPNLNAYTAAPDVREAEKSVIGSVIGNAEAARLAATVVQPEDFYLPQHEQAFTAALALLTEGQPVDVVTVTRRLTLDGLNPNGRAGERLVDAFAHAVPLASVTWHARIVHEDAQRRRLHELGLRTVQATGDPSCDVAEVAAKIAEQAHTVMESTGAAELAPLGHDFADLIDAIEAGITDAVPTGIVDLDRYLYVRPGSLVTVGARSGVGKSMFGVTMLRHVAVQLGRPVFYASIEMSRGELLSRVTAAETSVSLHRVVPNPDGVRPDEREWERIRDAQQRIADAPMFVDPTKRGVTVSHLRSRLMREQAKGRPPAVVIVDHMHIMASVQYNADQRRHQLDEIARGLKVLAEEMHIPVVALAQLNRKSDDRQDHKPAVGDLFEASVIEHHSDSIILLHRPEKHDPESPRSGEIDLIVAKNRSGPEFTVTCAYQGQYGRIVDMAREWSPSQALDRRS